MAEDKQRWLCPFISDPQYPVECKRQECMVWSGEDCSVHSILEMLNVLPALTLEP